MQGGESDYDSALAGVSADSGTESLRRCSGRNEITNIIVKKSVFSSNATEKCFQVK